MEKLKEYNSKLTNGLKEKVTLSKQKDMAKKLVGDKK